MPIINRLSARTGIVTGWDQVVVRTHLLAAGTSVYPVDHAFKQAGMRIAAQ